MSLNARIDTIRKVAFCFCCKSARQTTMSSSCRRVHVAASHGLGSSTNDVMPLSGRNRNRNRNRNKRDARLEKWELTVGIEIHAQLNTACKLFSSASTSANDAPNTHVALFDLAFPGTQPQFQPATLIPAIRAALALNCEVQRISRFDRKHYFYQDQPSGYQITQYYEPFARNGYVCLYDHDGIDPEDGEHVRIGIKQIQMEQDTAKTVHQPPVHLLDFNRVSHPLIEIISLPHIHHPATAAAYVRKVQALLNAVNANIIGIELGGLRADVNVSVKSKDASDDNAAQHEYSGVKGLGQRVEIKNLVSFKAVEEAIIAERSRQIDILESGGIIDGETRGWNIGDTETTRLRGKEGEVDYRYMPDPDIGPVIIGKDLLDYLKTNSPILPDEEIKTLTTGHVYGLTLKDAKTLIELDNGARLEYYKDVRNKLAERVSDNQTLNLHLVAKAGKTAGNWVLMELGGMLARADCPWQENPVSAEALADIIAQLMKNHVTGKTAKHLLQLVFDGDERRIDRIIEEDGLRFRPLSRETYKELAVKLMEENEELVKQVQQKGGEKKIKWFVGQMMRLGEQGRMEADKAEAMLKELFNR